VPSDVEITVKYGSGTESYDPSSPNLNPKVMYCDPYKADGTTSGFEKIVCTLWTDGAASVRVQAEGYPELVRDLSADHDGCGIVLSEEQLTLELAD